MEFIMSILEQYFWPIFIILVAFVLIIMVSCFKIFEKANIDGYKALIPIYNVYLWLDIADLPIFLIPLMFVPILNILIFFVASYRIGKNFRENHVFTMGLCFLPLIFYPLLALSNSLYKPAEERGIIRPQDENSMMYNQFPDVEEIVENSKIQSILKPVEMSIVEEEAVIPESEVDLRMPDKVPPSQALGVKVNDDNLILNIDDDGMWQDHQQLSEVEQTKKVVTIDPIKDDPLFNPDAKPIKVANLDKYKICPNCGTRLDCDAEICFLCGKSVDDEE